MAARLVEKIHLSARGLIKTVKKAFKNVKPPIKGPQGPIRKISIYDCLTAGLAIFKLKFPSLLQFEDAQNDKVTKQNLTNLFGLTNVPSDTYIREQLDEVEPSELRPAFTSVFYALQRGKALEKFTFLDGHYLMLSDGTGFFSSSTVKCANCCEKHHKNGECTYYHQMLCAVLAHPDFKEVIPLCPEPIAKTDGSKKNDCERNASERLLRDFRREHPHLPVILAEDGLSSNGPHLKLLKELDIRFITVVKPDGNKNLFEWVDAFKWDEDRSKWLPSQGEVSFKDDNGTTHLCRFISDAPLNETHSSFKVNYLEYWEIDKSGTTQYHNTWVTDLTITINNAYQLARGGRCRWRIENETFNTLKNQGYNFEHNYGHGYKNLSTIFAYLMVLAFLIDQAEQLCCGLFQGALAKLDNKKSRLWRTIRNLFECFYISSWESIYRSIIKGSESYAKCLDSS